MPSENFPFCTIDPAESRVACTDDRFDWLCQFYKPKSIVPAYLTVIVELYLLGHCGAC